MDAYLLAISLSACALGTMCVFVFASLQTDIREVRAQAMENANDIARLKGLVEKRK
jgi:hypothetical protein